MTDKYIAIWQDGEDSNFGFIESDVVGTANTEEEIIELLKDDMKRADCPPDGYKIFEIKNELTNKILAELEKDDGRE
jgi:hypothetical protein